MQFSQILRKCPVCVLNFDHFYTKSSPQRCNTNCHNFMNCKKNSYFSVPNVPDPLLRIITRNWTFPPTLLEAVVQFHLRAYPKVVWVQEAGPDAAWGFWLWYFIVASAGKKLDLTVLKILYDKFVCASVGTWLHCKEVLRNCVVTAQGVPFIASTPSAGVPSSTGSQSWLGSDQCWSSSCPDWCPESCCLEPGKETQ